MPESDYARAPERPTRRPVGIPHGHQTDYVARNKIGPKPVRETGKPIAQVARDLGINEGTLGQLSSRRGTRGGKRWRPRAGGYSPRTGL
jgi:hypothetical protein